MEDIYQQFNIFFLDYGLQKKIWKVNEKNNKSFLNFLFNFEIFRKILSKSSS